MRRNPPRRCERRWTLSAASMEPPTATTWPPATACSNITRSSSSSSSSSNSTPASHSTMGNNRSKAPSGESGRPVAGQVQRRDGQQSQSRGYFPGECHICHKTGHKAAHARTNRRTEPRPQLHQPSRSSRPEMRLRLGVPGHQLPKGLPTHISTNKKQRRIRGERRHNQACYYRSEGHHAPRRRG